MTSIGVLRQIISELRQACPRGSITRSYPTLKFILDQYRKFKTTDQQLCLASREMEHVGSTYLCYLRSSRLHNALRKEYHGRGERSVKDIANMVGFKLPHEPK